MADPFNEASSNKKVLTADESASGRIDAWLTAQAGEDLSRSRVKALIKEGAVTVNGEPARDPHRKIRPGDAVSFSIPDPEDPEPKGEAIPLEVLYEDDDLIVIAKPSGLVVHPAAGNWTGTLVNALIHHCGASLSGIGGVKRPGIVHRLDKDTSGVMVVAKNDIAHRHLADQFADHGRTGALERAYLALVLGRPERLAGTINAPLGRAGDRVRRAVKRELGGDAREAITHYRVVERFAETPDAQAAASLLECRLETGRTHQIRVHLTHLGHPLIGDRDYGAALRTKSNRLPEDLKRLVDRFPRQALHAFLLQFEHPRSGDIMRFEAPPPEDMAALLNGFRQL
ncbi:RluA family pseudouridine synthase [Pararhizobium haloflavum]|uniref:RluA family pseudouridine synthase n=1 Tax=Pararhizobium haloflavum TaxID=2037914 RepID=UPI000C185F8D|nr:RluA family pseudouridine synthase [Pararhizobium haloflavum]